MSYNKQGYRTILETAMEHDYAFVDFLTLNLDNPMKQIILRHDIDYSLPLALEIAKIDSGYKIKSTFALLISSPLYNPFTASSIEIINEIQQLGHNIALHYRLVPSRVADETRQDITREMQAMRGSFPYAQPVFIWHNLSLNNLFSDIEVLGLVNAYNVSPIERIHYISDSVLRHRAEDFLAVLDKHIFIQMLFHPIVWMSEKDNIVSMLAYALSGIIHECDHEFALNPQWQQAFPNGIPKEPLGKLEEFLNKRKEYVS